MAGKGPTVQDRAEAIRRLLFGLARGDDVPGLAAAIEELHPRHDTFPGEVFMRLSADALDVAGVGQDDPLPYTALRENYLGEFKFQGRGNRKIQFAILASASARGGIQPDLLDEVALDESIGAGLRSALVSTAGRLPGRLNWHTCNGPH